MFALTQDKKSNAFRFLKFPSLLYIEPTNDCNLNCRMCPRKESARKIEYMPFALFCEIINQVSHRNPAMLTLHQLGEPLLHPEIIPMIRYAKNKGIRHVRFATNATMLKEDLSRNLIESGLDSLTISMDSATAAWYCPEKSKEGFFADLDRRILEFITLRDRQGFKTPHVYAQIINMADTQDLITPFVDRWKGIADQVVIKQPLAWVGKRSISKEREPAFRFICTHHLYQGVVLSNGDATFCCLYPGSPADGEWVLGNAGSATLEDIFMVDRRKQMIEAQLRGDYSVVPYCKECPDWHDYLKAQLTHPL